MPKAVLITGTPGTGKTTLAKALAAARGWRYIDVKLLLHDFTCGYDRKRRVPIVDEQKLCRALEQMIRSSSEVLVIDSHLAHYVHPAFVRRCLVLKCSIPVLRRRLMAKKYSGAKIKENIEAELMDVCLHEAQDLGHHILIIDTTKRTDVKRVRL